MSPQPDAFFGVSVDPATLGFLLPAFALSGAFDAAAAGFESFDPVFAAGSAFPFAGSLLAAVFASSVVDFKGSFGDVLSFAAAEEAKLVFEAALPGDVFPAPVADEARLALDAETALPAAGAVEAMDALDVADFRLASLPFGFGSSTTEDLEPAADGLRLAAAGAALAGGLAGGLALGGIFYLLMKYGFVKKLEETLS